MILLFRSPRPHNGAGCRDAASGVPPPVGERSQNTSKEG
jgi:hypothetical protein